MRRLSASWTAVRVNLVGKVDVDRIELALRALVAAINPRHPFLLAKKDGEDVDGSGKRKARRRRRRERERLDWLTWLLVVSSFVLCHGLSRLACEKDTDRKLKDIEGVGEKQ